MKIKTVFKSFISGLCDYRGFSFSSGFSGVSAGSGEGACRRRHSGDICGLLFRRWFHGGKADAPG